MFLPLFSSFLPFAPFSLFSLYFFFSLVLSFHFCFLFLSEKEEGERRKGGKRVMKEIERKE